MDFDDRAELDTSQVEDVGSGGGSGGLLIGGGLVGVIALVAAVVLGVDVDDAKNLLDRFLDGREGNSQVSSTSDLSKECKTGADADQSEKCRVVGVVNSLQAYWGSEFSGYRKAKTTLFSSRVKTACGLADSSVGPFYCPADRHVYLDLSFFDDLRTKLGAKGGPFAQAYVIAHEYGHHVQNLLGTLARARNDRGATSDSVRVELQADCYAGVWAKNAVDTGFFAEPFTEADIKEALDAAAAVGDDRIQERSAGWVNPDEFTHGTSAQRMKWFMQGYRSGDPHRCDTFSGSI